MQVTAEYKYKARGNAQTEVKEKYFSVFSLCVTAVTAPCRLQETWQENCFHVKTKKEKLCYQKNARYQTAHVYMLKSY